MEKFKLQKPISQLFNALKSQQLKKSHNFSKIIFVTSSLRNSILVHLHVNKTSYKLKGFALGFALKQRLKATQK